MNQMNPDIQSEQPTPEAQEASQIPAQPEPVAVPAKVYKPQPSWLRRFFRQVLIWLLVIAASFLAGVITVHYVRYKPLSAAHTGTQTALNQANQEIDGLRAESERFNTTLKE